jgi:hypothetical protein
LLHGDYIFIFTHVEPQTWSGDVVQGITVIGHIVDPSLDSERMFWPGKDQGAPPPADVAHLDFAVIDRQNYGKGGTEEYLNPWNFVQW